MLSGMPATVLIVDDHDGFRSVARMLLESSGYEVIGEAEHGASALAAVRDLKPDLILLDIQLPDSDGFVLSRELADAGDPPAIVLISSREESDYGDEVSKAPVLGFIHKPELSGASLAAIEGVPRP